MREGVFPYKGYIGLKGYGFLAVSVISRYRFCHVGLKQGVVLNSSLELAMFFRGG